MSVKVYHGYRVALEKGDTFDLMDWTQALEDLRQDLLPQAEEMRFRRVFAAAIGRMDRWDTRDLLAGFRFKNPELTHLEAGLKHLKWLAKQAQKERLPTIDTAASLSWRQVASDKVLVLLFIENKEFRDQVIEKLHLEDWHWQNQTDFPERITQEEWDEREEDWKGLFGEDWAKTAEDSCHSFRICPGTDPQQVDFLFGWSETPDVIPLPWERRVEEVAFDLLFQELNPVDKVDGLVWSKLWKVQKAVREEGPLRKRYLEIQELVGERLKREPTFEDLKQGGQDER